MPASRQSLILATLLALAVALYFVDLGGASIWDANEAFYVETPREMIERGDYVNPTFNYEPRINKPVLSYWLVAAAYQLYGVSVGAQRAVIGLAALLTIGSLFLLASTASRWTLAPLLAAVGLAANPRFFMFARRILIDMGLTLLMTITLTCFAMAESRPTQRRRWLLAMYVAVGLGVLMKGPVAAVLPALAFVLYLVVHREWRRIGDMMLPAGALIVTVIVAPWYIALYLEHGWGPIASFFVGENLERYTSLVGPQARAAWFYLPVVFTDGLPWSLCLPAAVALWLRDRRMRPLDPDVRIRTLLVLWIAVFVGTFSLSQTKQDLYIFPIVGAVMALGGDVMARGLQGEARRWAIGVLAVAAVLLIAAGAGVGYLFARAGAVYALDGVQATAAVLVAGGVLAVAALIARALAPALLVTLCVPVVFCWLLALRVLPSFERYKPVVPLSETFLQHARRGDALTHYDVAMPSMVFYVRRHIDMLFEESAFLYHMQIGAASHVVLAEDRYAALKDRFGVPTCVLARRPTSDIKLREVLAGQPPPAVLLVTTRCP